MGRGMRGLLSGGIRILGDFGWGVIFMGGCGPVILRGGRGRRLVGWRGGAVRAFLWVELKGRELEEGQGIH